LLAGLLALPAAQAQRPRLAQSGPMPVNQAPGLPSTSPLTPETQMAPVGPPSTYASPPPTNSTLGSPVFDPYQTGGGAGNLRSVSPYSPPPPAYPASSGVGSLFSGLGATFNGGNPIGAPSPYGAGAPVGFPSSPPPGYATPGTNVAPPPFSPSASAPAYSPPPTVYPPNIYPNSTPSTLFPGGLSGPGGLFSSGGGAGGFWNANSIPEPFRLFQGPRLRHTWLAGGDEPEDVDINTTDVSIAMAFPNFLWSNQPLYVLPSFSLHLWDGPQGAAGGNADLPSRAYDAFIDVGWQSDPVQLIGAELGVRTGVFTDFDTMNSDSLRVRGKALGILRLSPTTTLKAGVLYADRNRVKLLPAGGLLCQPNPFVRYDLTFPNPKISRFFRTVGVYDTWGYVAGEFGGGAWTIARADGSSDSLDINDYRILLGTEWGRSDLIRAGRRTGFAEIGYVFQRQVEYENNPADNFDANDTFLIRVGIGY